MNLQRPSRLDWPFDGIKLVVTLVALVGVLVAFGGRPAPGQTAGPLPTATATAVASPTPPATGDVPPATNTPADTGTLPTNTPAPAAETPTAATAQIASPTVEPTLATVDQTATPAVTEEPTVTPTPAVGPVVPTDTPTTPPTPQLQPTATPANPFALRIIIPETGRTLSSQAQVFVGTGPAGEVLILLDESDTLLGKTTIADDGRWRIIIAADRRMPIGEHTVRAGVIDKAGNVVRASEPVIITVVP